MIVVVVVDCAASGRLGGPGAGGRVVVVWRALAGRAAGAGQVVRRMVLVGELQHAGAFSCARDMRVGAHDAGWLRWTAAG